MIVSESMLNPKNKWFILVHTQWHVRRRNRKVCTFCTKLVLNQDICFLAPKPTMMSTWALSQFMNRFVQSDSFIPASTLALKSLQEPKFVFQQKNLSVVRLLLEATKVNKGAEACKFALFSPVCAPPPFWAKCMLLMTLVMHSNIQNSTSFYWESLIDQNSMDWRDKRWSFSQCLLCSMFTNLAQSLSRVE